MKRVEPLGSAYGKIKVGDVLLKHDGESIACNGTIKYFDNQRISYKQLTVNKFVGDISTLTILRDGKQINVEITLKHCPFLVPLNLYGKNITYFILGFYLSLSLSLFPFFLNKTQHTTTHIPHTNERWICICAIVSAIFRKCIWGKMG